MMYTHKIQMAIKFAAKTHNHYQQQVRKGKDIPYITHSLTVGIILAGINASEDVVVAGILHDTIEDSIDEKKVTAGMITERFGKNVADLVMSVTEVDKSMSWEDRKREAIEHIKTFSHDSLLVKSADVISNVSEMLDDYKRDGDKIFERFKVSQDEKIISTLHTINAIVVRWADNPLRSDLCILAMQLKRVSGLYEKPIFAAPVITWKDYHENINLECVLCGWKGTVKESSNINTSSHYCLDVSCPTCDKMLLVVQYPFAGN